MNHVENHFVFLDNDRGEIDGPALQGLDRGKEHLFFLSWRTAYWSSLGKEYDIYMNIDQSVTLI